MIILEDTHPTAIHTLTFSPDGRTLASVSGRATVVKLWDLDTRKVRDELSGHRHRIAAVAFSPDSTLAATATSGGQIWLWNLIPSRKLVRQLEWPRVLVHATARILFSRDGQHLVTNMPSEGGFHVWRPSAPIQFVMVADSRSWRMATGHLCVVTCLAYSADGQTLATGSFDRSVRLRDLNADKSAYLDHGHKVHHVAFSPDGATLASGSPHGLVKVWDAQTGQKRSTLKGQAKPLHALCYSPDGRFIATAGGEGTVAFWDVATSRSRTALDWGIGTVHSVAFAPDGMRAAAGGMGKIVVWDVDWDL
jgi:WD40 repeat protein